MSCSSREAQGALRGDVLHLAVQRELTLLVGPRPVTRRWGPSFPQAAQNMVPDSFFSCAGEQRTCCKRGCLCFPNHCSWFLGMRQVLVVLAQVPISPRNKVSVDISYVLGLSCQTRQLVGARVFLRVCFAVSRVCPSQPVHLLPGILCVQLGTGR